MGRHAGARADTRVPDRISAHKGMLALDFDGVICDALDECALVTWLGERPHDRTVAGPGQLERLPGTFTERFRKVRDYARLLDHFLVAHLTEAGSITSQADFDRLFSSLPRERVARFTTAASEAREWFRAVEPDFWLGLHTLYPGVPELLRHAGAVVIVTAKDESSVRSILRRNGLEWTVAEVYGECAHKAAAVQDACARRGVPLDAVTFVDDNLPNVRNVAAVGVRARWAQWGYQTPEHRAEAALSGIEGLELAGLAGLSAAL
ncbi:MULTISPECIES: HAD family hydrolase [Streptomyces]|uniref:Phosphoglycolate phosphatase n=1 Tax=Streptomyces chrestomyceticus JCM 4735 TaxID=1306181 RepID=A0A7U9L1X4_9ACTN|nr:MULTISPECIES: HAD family hydrolase [Streptomyces]GCD39559.1 phosphoglycolate phosphatase [Streptomyces chrestomyceticus JCM 4735]